jgi:putative flavoprotein involved in K+ transport
VFEARQVVVATGPFQVPFVPPVAKGLDPGVHQLHSADYRRPEAIPAGKVLVVGAANSGCQIAEELSATRGVELSAGQRIPAIPQRPLGRDVWWWASGLRLDRVTVGSRLGRRLAGRDQVIGGGPRQLARRHGIRIRPRVTGATGRTVRFADGGTAEVDTVVWATGFRTDHAWIDVPGLRDGHGRILHQRGVSPSSGLYLLGLTWLHTRGSALLGWVGDDAEFLAEQIVSLQP